MKNILLTLFIIWNLQGFAQSYFKLELCPEIRDMEVEKIELKTEFLVAEFNNSIDGYYEIDKELFDTINVDFIQVLIYLRKAKYTFQIESSDFLNCNDLYLCIIDKKCLKKTFQYNYLVCGSFGVISDKGKYVKRRTGTH